MNRAILVFAAVCAAPILCSAQVPKNPEAFESYRMVRLRNIFDPQRAPVANTSDQPQAVATPPPKASDYIVLTGVMFDGGRELAFFSGSRPDYDKVLPVNTDLVGAKLTRIAPSGIEIERAGKTIPIAIGQTVPFDSSPPGAPPASFAAAAAAASTSGTDDSDTSSVPSANLDAVMRRMMERRQQELR